MRTLSTFIILFLILNESFAQQKFEKGWLISADRQRKECLIRNMEWKSNPGEFVYKLSESDQTREGDLNSILEFGIANSCKFVNATVRIDLQTKPVVGSKNEVIPDWTRKRLFLKVLSEGKAKLYSYQENKVKRFFYSLNDTSITQLVYLEALNGTTLVKNTSYQQQLWGNLKYPKATMNQIKEIDYTEKELVAYFREYNSSFGEATTEIQYTKRKSYFNLKLTPGLNTSKVDMTTVVSSRNEQDKISFDNKSNFRMGLEAELILPFNNYHWGILFEPTYQSYSGEAKGKYGSSPSTISSQTIEFPIGLRYYLPISENTHVFLNGFLIPGFAIDMNSSISYSYFDANLVSEKTKDIKSGSSASLGAGVEHKRFSLETRYYTNRNLLNSHPSESANYSRFSIILGYKIFKTRLK